MAMILGEERSTIRPPALSVLFVENAVICTPDMVEKTTIEYRKVISTCKALFEKKTRDYGTAWRILRLPSITDQIFIKAQRGRSIQEKGAQKVDDPIKDEFVGIINYCIIALIQMKLPAQSQLEMTYEQLDPLYQEAADETLALLENKNHDYGDAEDDLEHDHDETDLH